MWKQTSVVVSHQVCSNLSKQPWETNTMINHWVSGKKGIWSRQGWKRRSGWKRRFREVRRRGRAFPITGIAAARVLG